MKNLFLIDAMGLVFRAYHAMSRMGLQNKAGEPTGAVFGFATMMLNILEKEKPEGVIAAFDTKSPTFRHKRYELYKANRDAFPEELTPQLPRIKSLLDYSGIPRIEIPGFEADDIVGTLAVRAAEQGIQVVCITSDKDYFQLVNDRVLVYRPSKGETGFDIYGKEGVIEKFGVAPELVTDVLALMGDSSDNVPGVKGVGEKTALQLIHEFGSLDNIYANIQSVAKNSVRNNLIEHKEMAYLSKELVTIHTEMSLELSPEQCRIGDADMGNLDSLFSELGLRSLRDRWMKTIDKSSGNSVATSFEFHSEDALETIKTRKHHYTKIDSITLFDLMIDQLNIAKEICVDLETTSLDTMNCAVLGIALSAREGEAYYVILSDWKEGVDVGRNCGLNNLSDSNQQNNSEFEQSSLFEIQETSIEYTSNNSPSGLSTKYVVEKLKPLLENREIPKIGQNLKFDALILLRYGITVSPFGFDTMLASYILDPDKQHNMDALAERWMKYSPISIKTLIGDNKKGNMSDAPIDAVAEYAAEDADVTIALSHILAKEVEREQLSAIAYDIEFPVSEILVQMEYNGIAIDSEALKELSIYIRRETEELRTKIFQESGTEFNIDSPKQLGEVLFEKMQLPTIKKNKTGYSTDAYVLGELSGSYPIAGMIQEYRQLQKLQNTYVESLPRMINPRSGRIHTTYNQTIAGTGRLSSVEPNLQNIPIRTPLGRSIRKAFVPQSPDAVLFSCDYSQIELRIMAHISGDETLTSAFQHGMDVHAATAASLFGKDVSEISSDERRIAKTVNFGIMYGQGSFGLAQQLSISRKEAKSIIEQYFIQYPKIKQYFDDVLAQARKKGYTETIWGRRKYFPTINSSNGTIRQATERAAVNMPIQGTAADMMKKAMIDVHNIMKKEKVRSLMLLQIHDELVFEAYKDELDILKELVVNAMENALPLGVVPVKTESGFGINWDEAH